MAARKQDARRRKISQLLSQIEDKLGADMGKATLGDFIKLMQLERELEEDEQPREIKVTWVEPKEA
jgi:hypothetical protein